MDDTLSGLRERRRSRQDAARESYWHIVAELAAGSVKDPRKTAADLDTAATELSLGDAAVEQHVEQLRELGTLGDPEANADAIHARVARIRAEIEAKAAAWSRLRIAHEQEMGALQDSVHKTGAEFDENSRAALRLAEIRKTLAAAGAPAALLGD